MQFQTDISTAAKDNFSVILPTGFIVLPYETEFLSLILVLALFLIFVSNIMKKIRFQFQQVSKMKLVMKYLNISRIFNSEVHNLFVREKGCCISFSPFVLFWPGKSFIFYPQGIWNFCCLLKSKIKYIFNNIEWYFFFWNIFYFAVSSLSSSYGEYIKLRKLY